MNNTHIATLACSLMAITALQADEIETPLGYVSSVRESYEEAVKRTQETGCSNNPTKNCKESTDV